MKKTITSRGVTFARPRANEKAEQAAILEILAWIGGRVYVLGTRRAQYCHACGARTNDQGTRQTPGLADVFAFLPPRGSAEEYDWRAVWIECKGQGGSLSEEQVEFRRQCALANIDHVVGGVEAFYEWLVQRGYMGRRRA